jgi:hypothetical protein
MAFRARTPHASAWSSRIVLAELELSSTARATSRPGDTGRANQIPSAVKVSKVAAARAFSPLHPHQPSAEPTCAPLQQDSTRRSLHDRRQTFCDD